MLQIITCLAQPSKVGAVAGAIPVFQRNGSDKVFVCHQYSAQMWFARPAFFVHASHLRRITCYLLFSRLHAVYVSRTIHIFTCDTYAIIQQHVFARGKNYVCKRMYIQHIYIYRIIIRTAYNYHVFIYAKHLLQKNKKKHMFTLARKCCLLKNMFTYVCLKLYRKTSLMYYVYRLRPNSDEET